MLKLAYIFFLGSLTLTAFPQSNFFQPDEEYGQLIAKANQLRNEKKFKECAFIYDSAFALAKGEGLTIDRLNAAEVWALANNADKAFFYLKKAVIDKNEFNVSDTDLLLDSDLVNLHKDGRWKLFLDTLRQNKEKKEARLNKSLVSILDAIFNEDQLYRRQVDSIASQSSWEAAEIPPLLSIIKFKDSINLIKVRNIIDKYGWLGPDIIGDQGSTTLFLVIQHSDLKTQEKYLPVLKAAVKDGKAKPSALAYLEDRVAIAHGEKQVYGTQIKRDERTGKYSIEPIDDEPNVNKRRASVGLERLEEYTKQWGIDYILPAPDK